MPTRPEPQFYTQLTNIINSLKADLKKAWSTISDIEEESYYQRRDSDDHTLESLYDYLSFVNRGIYMKLCVGLKLFDLTELLQDLRTSIQSKNRLNQVEMSPGGEGLFCGTTAELSQYIDSLDSMLAPEDDLVKVVNPLEINRLKRMLSETPKLIYDHGLDPRNEKDVRLKVYNFLSHVYPDTIRELPISKVTKVYKPDIGIKSLKTAIEYKFIDSEEEYSVAVGGIYEDIHGYSGSEDWTTFIAVLYMTEAFRNPAQLEADWEMSKVPQTWIPILVHGRGERVKRAKPTIAKMDKTPEVPGPEKAPASESPVVESSTESDTHSDQSS